MEKEIFTVENRLYGGGRYSIYRLELLGIFTVILSNISDRRVAINAIK